MGEVGVDLVAMVRVIRQGGVHVTEREVRMLVRQLSALHRWALASATSFTILVGPLNPWNPVHVGTMWPELVRLAAIMATPPGMDDGPPRMVEGSLSSALVLDSSCNGRVPR